MKIQRPLIQSKNAILNRCSALHGVAKRAAPCPYPHTVFCVAIDQKTLLLDSEVGAVAPLFAQRREGVKGNSPYTFSWFVLCRIAKNEHKKIQSRN